MQIQALAVIKVLGRVALYLEMSTRYFLEARTAIKSNIVLVQKCWSHNQREML